MPFPGCRNSHISPSSEDQHTPCANLRMHAKRFLKAFRSLQKSSLSFVLVFIITLSNSLTDPRDAIASPYTPLEWQREVSEHVLPPFKGQRKHTTWIRDRNRNFIDDEIEKRYKVKEFANVNVVVDLNACLTEPQIKDLLSSFGQIKYVGKLITFVLLDRVPVTKLPQLATLPQVAMVEQQPLITATDGISGGAIQGLKSDRYASRSAQDLGFTGKNVNIAIVDTGVDATHEAFAGKLVWAVDATTSPTPNELGNNPTNNDSDGHGTKVAGVALARPPESADKKCRTDPPVMGTHCKGVATDAGLVDVKVCRSRLNCDKLMQGLDWIGTNGQKPEIQVKVVNISLATCHHDDGTSAVAQQANYLVTLGMVVVVAHGNKSTIGQLADCTPIDEIQVDGDNLILTPDPGSASFAITVQATRDNNTVDRVEDILYDDEALLGPRIDVNNAGHPLLGLKPEISAPGTYIWTTSIHDPSGNLGHFYDSFYGTSAAAPHVAGGAAVILEALPQIDPGSLKDLLKMTADSSRNNSDGRTPLFPEVDGTWVRDFGSGIINVFCAIHQATGRPNPVGLSFFPCLKPTMQGIDVGFPHCVGPPDTPGEKCTVQFPQPPWNNTFDITTATPPQEKVSNTITAQVHNSGPVAASVLVNFGVYDYAAGNKQFHHIGTVRTTIPAMSTIPVEQQWIPQKSNHNCIQVSIQYGLDSNFDNNVTQRNLQVLPLNIFSPRGLAASTEFQVESPFHVPTKIQISTNSNAEGWRCEATEESFQLDPSNDCPRRVQLTIIAPKGVQAGDRAECNFSVSATPYLKPGEAAKSVVIGGVTTEVYAPSPLPTKPP